jgi:hypothetical protein
MEKDWFKAEKQDIVERLINTLESEALQFIGKFNSAEDKDFGFFKDVRSVSGVRKYYPTNDGSPDDLNSRPLEVWSKKTILFNAGKNKIILEEGKWYKFYAVPAQSQLAVKNENPFLLQTDLSRAVDIKPFKGSELIDNIQQDSIRTPESVKGKLTRSIEAISNEINTQPATFIFELIQNADDYPNDQNNVRMSFDIKSPYLVVKHNGSRFDVNNAVAICDINEGDKRSEVEKIGFKGIGFKSIFKDCNLAYLKSGDYSFRFDEMKWRNEGRKLFWQITPINTDDKEYQNELMPYDNVNLVIHPREKSQLNRYRTTLIEHFKDERILLFLRNVKQIDFKLNEDSFSISNTANKWRILKSKDIVVDDHIRDELNRGISLNDKRIPLKFQGIQKTDIGFGFLVEENVVRAIDDATIYAYLPTKVNLGFGFLLNGNFIPDGSRTHLHQDLSWNEFLFEKAGEHFPNKLLELIDSGADVSSVLELLPDFDKLLDVNDDEIKQFVSSFQKGFYQSIEEIELFPNTIGGTSKLRDLILDETGVSGVLGEQFLEIINLEGSILSYELSSKALRLIKKIMKNFEIESFYTKEIFSKELEENKYNTWLREADHSFKLICHCSENKSLNELLENKNLFLTTNNYLWAYKNMYKSLPEGVPLFESETVDQTLLKELLNRELNFTFKNFEATQHLTEYYNETLNQTKSNIDEFNSQLIDNDNIDHLWCFVFDYFEELKEAKELLSLLKKTVIASYNEDISVTKYHPVNQCYLSDAYASEYAIETLVKQLMLPNTHFISGHLISESRPSDKWTKVFKKLGVKTDLQQVVNEIIENLQNIPVENHFECGMEIFKYWRKNKDKESKLTEIQIKSIQSNLKIKQVNGNFSSKLYITDHYTHNFLLDSVLKKMDLPDLISSEYEPDKSKSIEWKEFFVLIRCLLLENKQEVFEEKLCYLDSQKEIHFEVLADVSELYNNRETNKLNFDIQWNNYFFLLSQNGELISPKDLHFSSVYKPVLDIQNDEIIKNKVCFLNKDYNPQKISKSLLKIMGVNEGFKIDFYKEPILLKNLSDKNYSSFVQMNQHFLKDKANLLVDWNKKYSYHIDDKIFLRNYTMVNYYFLLQFPTYYDFFVNRLININSQKFFIEDTILSIWLNRNFKVENYISFLLNQFTNFPSEEGQRRKPKEMFSKSLERWVTDKSLVPKFDFRKIKIESQNVSLEELIGIKQELDFDSIIELLKRKEPLLKLVDFKDLEIIRILNSYKLEKKELSVCHLYNNSGHWKPASELFQNEGDFDIDQDHLIHPDLVELVSKLNIRSLKEDDLELRIYPSDTNPTNEIIEFFEEKGKYIAFEIESTAEYKITLDKIITDLRNFDFYQVESIERYFPFEGVNYSDPKRFFVGDFDSVYFVDDWRLNNELHNWLIESVLQKKINKDFFTNVIFKNEDELIEFFNFKNKYASEILLPQKSIESTQSQNDKFVKEVEDFISSQLEETEWSGHITELKMLLQLNNNIGERNQKIYNLLAKLKLAKKRNIKFDSVNEDDKKFNLLEGNNEKYIVHSARGSFAYIAPFEILKMKNDGFKMALDFGAKKEIKIYEKAEDILSLNTNHLLLYQDKKSIEDLIVFCEKNKDANKRLLIIDKENASQKSKELLKLMMPDEEI